MTSILENSEFIAWLETKPPKVQEVIRRCLPGRYRLRDQEAPLVAYYIPQSYDEPEDPPPCRYFPVKLFEQRNPRCAYCQTLVVITASVRCPSCGAPR